MNRRAEHTIQNGSERVAKGLRSLATEAEALMRATANYSGEGLAAARHRMEEQLDQARELMSDAETFARAQARRAVRGTDRYVHENPWQAVGIAMAAGMVVGWLSRR